MKAYGIPKPLLSQNAGQSSAANHSQQFLNNQAQNPSGVGSYGHPVRNQIVVL